MTEKELLAKTLEEKMFTAEKRVSILRVLLIALNSVVYLWFMDQTYTYNELAFSIVVVANIYAVSTFFFEPYRKVKLLRSIYFTIVADGVLSMLWIIATGYMDSPFYLVWYVSLISIAFRYSLKHTITTTFIYLVLYMLVFALDPYSTIELSDLMVRLGYIPLAGMLGMYVSLEITDQIDGKVKIIQGEVALKKAHHELELKVKERTSELQVMNKDLTDSINYAERIQSAIFPKMEDITSTFQDAFVIHLPKDIVSGDFYWFHHKDGISHIAVVDCTGHGVPGAMMSMIGNNLLNRAIVEHQLNDPGKILKDMDRSLEEMLKDDAEGLAVNDGMDLSLCMIDHSRNTLEFAAAQSSALIIQGGELRQLQGSKFSIGGFGSSGDKMFKTTSISFNPSDLMYMFSDGYQDQFGGNKGKKFYKKNLIHLIESGSDKTMKQQELTILETFVNWKGNEMQMDDVTVMGIRL
ncbi:MAG TPA: hypothetical protein DCR04_06540 [Flavobacteriales bacterium]|nr:hypothetical protein [Flavobacteriales bacterium]